MNETLALAIPCFCGREWLHRWDRTNSVRVQHGLNPEHSIVYDIDPGGPERVPPHPWGDWLHEIHVRQGELLSGDVGGVAGNRTRISGI